MPRRHHDRCRKVVTAAVAAVLFVVPFLATNAGSAGITQPVTVVTSVGGKPGTTATVGKEATVSFMVTNKATNGAKLGLFTIVVPKGVSGVGRADMSSTAWSELILPCGTTPRCSALVFASATRSSGYLAPGASLTVSIKLTPNGAGTLAFPMLGIGNGLFTATSTPTITVVPGPAAELRITAITDSHTPPLGDLSAGSSFKVAFQVVDVVGNLVTSPDVTVKLSAANLGLAVLNTAAVTSSNGTGVINAVYLGPAVTALNLSLTAGGITSPVTPINIVATGDTEPGKPHVDLTITIGDVTLPTGAAIAHLTNGANGPVTFTIGPCVPDPTTDCQIDGRTALSEVSLQGDFAGLYGTGLKEDLKPAEMDWECNPAACKPPQDPNAKSIGDLQIDEYNAHPVMAAPSSGDGTLQPFQRVPACNDLRPRPIPTGVIANDSPFCVDVGAISRSDTDCGTLCWSGNLTMPVLFLNDPRFYMG